MCSPPYLPHGQVQRLCIHLYQREREREREKVVYSFVPQREREREREMHNFSLHSLDKFTITVMIYLIHASFIPLSSLSIQTRSSIYYLDFTCFIGL